MDQYILGFVSVVFFCICCHYFIRAALVRIPLLAIERPYARGAMQLGKAYKTLAWGLMTMTFLFAMAFSFQQIFLSF